MTTLQKLAKTAIRHGLLPEAIGNASVFQDEQYMLDYLRHIAAKWPSPTACGCTERHQERARRAWANLTGKPVGRRSATPTARRSAR